MYPMKPSKPDTPFDFSMQVRTASLPKFALDHAVMRLRKHGVEFKGKRVTQEAVINATFLMLDSMPDDELVSRVRPHVEDLEARLGIDSGVSADPSTEIVVSPSVTKDQPSSATHGRRKRDA